MAKNTKKSPQKRENSKIKSHTGLKKPPGMNRCLWKEISWLFAAELKDRKRKKEAMKEKQSEEKEDRSR